MSDSVRTAVVTGPWFTIRGRRVYPCLCPFDWSDRRDGAWGGLWRMEGQVDLAERAALYRVVGVETYATFTGPREGGDVNLMLEPVRCSF